MHIRSLSLAVVVILIAGMLTSSRAQEPAPGGRQDAAPPRAAQPSPYRIFQLVGPATIDEKLNEAAGAGYRLVGYSLAGAAAGTVFLLRYAPPATGAYEYGVIAGGPGAFGEQLRSAAAKGFTLTPSAILSDTTHGGISFFTVLEKAPGTPPLEYEIHTKFIPSRQKHEIEKQLKQGDVAVGWGLYQIIWRTDAGISRQQAVEFFRKRLPKEYSPSDREFIELEREINVKASSGYRLIDLARHSDFNGHPEAAVLMARSGPAADLSYRVVTAADWKELEAALTQAAGRGYRFFPRVLCTTHVQGAFHLRWSRFLLAVLESSNSRYEYRVVVSDSAGDLLKQINAAAADAWQVVPMSLTFDHFVDEKDVSGNRLVALLERAAAAPATGR